MSDEVSSAADRGGDGPVTGGGGVRDYTRVPLRGPCGLCGEEDRELVRSVSSRERADGTTACILDKCCITCCQSISRRTGTRVTLLNPSLDAFFEPCWGADVRAEFYWRGGITRRAHPG